MPSLLELQTGMAAAVFGESPAVARHVRAGRFPADRLLQIYRNNSFASLTGALADLYPVVEKLVGHGFFQYCADRYIRRFPSQSGNLHDFGGRFAEFLADFPAAADLPYLPDVARLEWAWHEAFHAADHAALPLARLASVPPARYGQLLFKLHPSARLLASDFPILRIWQANQDNAPALQIRLDEGGDRLLVLRRDLEIEVHRLAPGEHQLLAVLARGGDFALACEQSLEAEPGLDLGQTLSRQVQSGCIADFHLPSP